MAHEDDLDWLYGRGPAQRPDQPDPTRVMPVEDAADRPSRTGSTGASGSAKSRGTTGADAAARVRPQPPPRPASPVRPQPAPRPTGRDDAFPPGTSAGLASRPPHKRHRVRIVLAAIAVVIVATIVWLVAVPMNAFGGNNKVDTTVSGARPPQQPGTTYLLVGSDSRAGLTAAEKKRLGTGSAAGGRTDSIMLLDVPASGKPALISLPRDSYVPIPGHGKNKINAAYAFGGAPLLIQTVEQATGVRVDHYAEIGFAGFAGLVDAVGGVDVCLKAPMKDKDAHIDLPKGCQTLNGKNALGYVRMRHHDPLGDLGRVQRQRQIVGAIMKKAASPMSVINPVRYWNLTHAAAHAVAFGQDTSTTDALPMALAMKKLSGNGGLTLTVPISNANYRSPHGDAVLWDPKRAKEMFADVARGDTAGLAKFAHS